MKRILTVLIFASGCGPIYDTVYDFTPPSSAVGRSCIEGCDDSKSDCESAERDRVEFCEERQQRQMDQCNDRVLREKNRAPKWTECGKTESCTADNEKCDNRYRVCYQACGGTVTSKQECVAFCDSAKK